MYYTDDSTNGNYILFNNLLIILKHNYHYVAYLISSFLQTNCRWCCSDKCRRTSQSRVTHWYCNTLEIRKTNTTMFFKSDYHLWTPRRRFLIDLFNRRLFFRLHLDHRISRKYRQTPRETREPSHDERANKSYDEERETDAWIASSRWSERAYQRRRLSTTVAWADWQASCFPEDRPTVVES